MIGIYKFEYNGKIDGTGFGESGWHEIKYVQSFTDNKTINIDISNPVTVVISCLFNYNWLL